MSDSFQIHIRGNADEATRLAILADLDSLAERYPDVFDGFDVHAVAAPPSSAVSLRRPNEAERLQAEADERDRAEQAEAEAARAEQAAMEERDREIAAVASDEYTDEMAHHASTRP